MVLGFLFLSIIILRKENIVSSIVIFCLLQSILCFLQLFGVVEGNHPFFSVTGIQGNPGQLGCIQAIGFVCNVILIVNHNIAWKKVLSYISLLSISLSLVLADSRISVVAVMLSMTIIGLQYYKNVLNRKMIIIILGTLVIVVGALLYCYRPSSVHSRLLIWRVSADMIADNPIVGFGIGGFPMNYMYYQAQYFKEHPSSIFNMVADNVVYPYNEILHIWINYGIIGACLFIGIIFLVVFYNKNKLSLTPYLTFLIISLFSYPFNKLQLSILVSIVTGLLFHVPMSQNICRVIGYFSITIILICFFITNLSHQEFKNAYLQLANGEYVTSSVRVLNTIFSNYWCDIETNSRYSSLVENDILKRDDINFEKVFVNSEILCKRGDLQVAGNNYLCAEQYYRDASFMIPSRIRPHYKLWNLYLLEGKDKDAISEAKIIMKMPLKVENTYTLRVKSLVSTYLEKCFNDETYDKNI